MNISFCLHCSKFYECALERFPYSDVMDFSFDKSDVRKLLWDDGFDLDDNDF